MDHLDVTAIVLAVLIAFPYVVFENGWVERLGLLAMKVYW